MTTPQPGREFPLLFRGRPCRIWREWVNPQDPNDGYVVIQFQNGGAVTVANRSELSKELSGRIPAKAAL